MSCNAVLYRIQQDGSLRVMPPANTHQELFHQAHGGIYGSHLGDSKLYSELLCHYWWPKMQSDITHWVRAV